MATGSNWQKPASWFFSTPRFLAARRSPCRAAAKKLLLLRLPRNITQGSADPCAIPGGLVLYCLTGRASSTVLVSTLVLDCNCKPVCSSFNDLPAKQRTYSLSPPQGIFALQKSLRGDCPRKEISRGNLLCSESGPTNLSYPRRLSAQKYVTTPDWENLCTGQPRGARGTAVPFVSGRVQRNPFQGVPLGNFFAEARHRASLRS